ncbi:hypothetical protein C4D60_Mb11t03550 [Musa balbisiana]|uniref:Uncharacterized protein n=1 Tax=Musa balbisiana TaxID=52838 RepID=A0A4S8J3X7_MUSBA|nr:hypothetical protein C4D60_Mb11t03550 [Musa balbisiana]
MIIPEPPALLTTSSFSALPLPPSSHTTILPWTSTPSKEPLRQKEEFSLPVAWPGYTRGSILDSKSRGWDNDSPSNSCPSPSLTVDKKDRSVVLAPTVSSHGASLVTPPCATGLEWKAAEGPPREREITSTPSSTAASMAANMS